MTRVPDKNITFMGSCTYLNDYSMILHKGGPTNDYGITRGWPGK